MQIYHYIFLKNNIDLSVSSDNQVVDEDEKYWDSDSSSLLLKNQGIDILETNETDEAICHTISKRIDNDEPAVISAIDDNIYIVYKLNERDKSRV